MQKKTKQRFEFITLSDVGRIWQVNNGKNFFKVKATLKMVGHKFGEFCITKIKKKSK